MPKDYLVNDLKGRNGRVRSDTPPKSMGLLTKTLAHSPVIRWMFPAKIRHRALDDVVFVGEDSIQLKHIETNGHLSHVATKADFDDRIMSARVLGNADHDQGVDFMDEIKVEQHDTTNRRRLPPQCLVLVLESERIVFMFAFTDDSGAIGFETSSIPLPSFPRGSQKLGKHLAVDPLSRAIAVAAAQESVLVYSAKPMEDDNAQWEDGFLPISYERPLVRISGVIVLMEFLHPPGNDPDHVILLLVVTNDGTTSLVYVDWLHSADVQTVHCHAPVPISKGAPIPNVLIPLESSAAFILTTGPDVAVYTDILSGHIQGPHKIELPSPRPKRPGSSPLLSRWVAWARPRRNGGPDRIEDHLYLAREDGDVEYLVLARQNPYRGAYAEHVNTFECHIDSAFNCYGATWEKDVLCIGPYASQGGTYTIAPLPDTPSGIGSELISLIPNWMPTFDAVISKLPRIADGTTRSRESIFLPCGRQPFGRLTEIRHGLEARSGMRICDARCCSATRLWVLPLHERQDLLLLSSGPTDSRLLRVSATNKNVELLEGSHGFNFGHRTLAALAFSDDCTIQVTERSIWMSWHRKFDVVSKEHPADGRITAAALDEEHQIGVRAVRVKEKSVIELFDFEFDDEQTDLKIRGQQTLPDVDVVSATIFRLVAGMFAVFGTYKGSLLFCRLSPTKGLVPILRHDLCEDYDMPIACEDVVILTHCGGIGERFSSPQHNAMLLCGLRNGTLFALELYSDQQEPLSIKTSKSYHLGLTSVKLLPARSQDVLDDKPVASCLAYATCGNGLFQISSKGADPADLKIQDVLITDVGDQSFQQGSISAMAEVPSLEYGDLGRSIVFVSGNEVFFTQIDDQPKVVTRSVPVPGIPTRAIYSSSYRCFVTVSAEINVYPSMASRSHESRSVRSVIHFTSSYPNSWEYTHELQAGTRIWAIMEWTYTDKAGKNYAFIVVGSGPIDRSCAVKGEITLLQPVMRNNAIKEVRTVKKMKTPNDDPVYALAAYGELGLVASTGRWVCVYRYLPSESKFALVGKMSFCHSVVNITTTPPQIHVLTSDDSCITLEFAESAEMGAADVQGSDGVNLSLVAGGKGKESGAHHVTLDVVDGAWPAPARINLFSTRDCRVVGHLAPSPTEHTHSKSVTVLFKARLSRSLIRITKGNIRPPWKPATVPGILEDKLVGTTADGTIVGLAVLQPGLAHRLKWIQTLCERSARICPMSYFLSDLDGDDADDQDVVLPPRGFEHESVPGEESAGYYYAGDGALDDMHINGDILQRLVDRGGSAMLIGILTDEAERKDRIGDWVRENMEEQCALAEKIMEEVTAVLDRWW